MRHTWSLLQKGLLKVLLARAFHELQSPKESKFWLVLHKLGDPQELVGAINTQTPISSLVLVFP